MRTHRELPRPWALMIINCVAIAAVLAVHPYLIAVNVSALVDSWTYYFVFIEVVLIIYLILNIVFLIIIKMDGLARRLLWWRYLLIDSIAILIVFGMIACIVVYALTSNSLDSSSLSYSDSITLTK